MFQVLYPGKRITREKDWGKASLITDLLTKYNALCHRFVEVLVGTKLQIEVISKLLTDTHHALKTIPAGTKEKNIISKDSYT